MFNYSINYSLQIGRLLPTFLRNSKIKAYAEALTMPTVKGHIYDWWYVFGLANYQQWTLTLETNKGDRVRRHAAVYEQISDDPITGLDPLDNSVHFKLVIDDFRGYKQRLRHTSQVIALEYVLNQWFGTAFRQPSEGASDIFITLNEDDGLEFWIGETPDESGWIAGDATSPDYSLIHDEADAYAPLEFDFVVNIPDAFTAEQEDEVKGIVNRLMVYGTNYNVIRY